MTSYTKSNGSFFHRIVTASSSAFGSDQASISSFASSLTSGGADSISSERRREEAKQETLSFISRSFTATSVNSSATSNMSFESKWMPNSEVVKPQTYKLSLKLTPDEIELLRWSWRVVTTTDSRAGDDTSSVKSRSSNNFNTADFSSYLFCVQFYNNLISMDGTIEEMIPSIRHQASAFASVINQAIGTLEDLSKMQELMTNLGKLHARILGIDSPYFKTMGEALMKTFRNWFGNDEASFPLVLEQAWIKLYCYLANSILQGGIDPYVVYNSSTPSLVPDGRGDGESFSIQNKPFQQEPEMKTARAAAPKFTSPTKSAAKASGHSSSKHGRKHGLRNKNEDCVIM